MYNAGLVCVVKSNGKILREDKDVCFLPFNSEYSLLIKNLETRNVLVKISIDGQDVLDGNSLIIHPNTEIELEGFMKGSIAKNKFKFIKKTKEISDYRGDKIDDGIIRIEYQFEKIIPVVSSDYYHYHYHNYYYPYPWTIGTLTLNDTTLPNSSVTYTSSNCFVNNCCTSIPQIDDGITVKGSEVNQSFTYGNIGALEDTKRVIILRLIGTKESGKIVEKPLTIQSRKLCSTCGKKSKSHLKFCSNCGTFLE
jgi:hypothetical protein